MAVFVSAGSSSEGNRYVGRGRRASRGGGGNGVTATFAARYLALQTMAIMEGTSSTSREFVQYRLNESLATVVKNWRL